MAEVIFVCVRADVEHAEALAEMFEAVGFTTDGYSPDDGAAEAAPASIVLWSDASMRSRPFLDAAERLIETGNAIVVCLSAPLAEIAGTPVFDLSAWNGDANEEAVDPLFFEVDRRVMKARGAAEVAPRAVALVEDDGPPPETEISEAENDYFVQYGADGFAGLSAGAWSAPIEIETAAPARPPRAYRGAGERRSVLRHGGAAARMMALVLLLGGGVAFAATTMASHEAQQVRHAAHEPAPLYDVAMAGDAATPEVLPKPDALEQPPPHVREPASAPASALRDLNAAYEPPAATQVLSDAPSVLPLWLEADLSAAPLAGAPLVAAMQEDAALGSSDLPDELFKPDPKAPAAA